MRKSAAIIVLLALSVSAAAQQLPKAQDFQPVCDTLSAKLKERMGVESELKLYKVQKSGKNLNLYFNSTLSDYPWHKEDQEWFRKALAEEMKSVTRDYGLGRILTKNNSFEDFSLPLIGNDGKAPAYNIVKADPRSLGRARFIEKSGRKKFLKGMEDRYIALWQSHGMYYNEENDEWRWQRAPLHRTVEDMFTQSFVLPYLIPMLENAGAYVMTPRERDTQRHEVITDNDLTFEGERGPLMRKTGIYSETGKWQNAGTGFADTKATYSFSDNPFLNGSARQTDCSGSGKAGARAIWTPYIEERGTYAVYISYASLDKSSTAARYTVKHLGGESTFLVNQTMGGGTWIYLGSFEFDKGNSGCVILDNSGESGKVVTADAVKIGGGMGKLERGGRISGVPSYAEGAHYWMQWAGVDSTITRGWPTDYTNDYSARGAWTEMMRKEKGIPFDLALGFHTDAGLRQNDSIVGTLAIYSYPWENKLRFDDGRSRMASRLMAEYVQDQVVADIREDFDSLWTRREIWDRSYSESRTPSVPAMILELLSHQNFADMLYGQDPSFRFTVSRAVYKGLLKTLSAFYRCPYVVQPLPVHGFSARFSSPESVRLEWLPTADSKEPTAVAESYMVYTRIDSMAFDAGIEVKDNFAEMKIEPGHIYSYRVAAVNEGGISFPSEILSVGRCTGNGTEVTVVNNFDRVSAPARINGADFAGFDSRSDNGVPYIRDISFIGENYEFRRNAEYVDDDYPGFGASLTDQACYIVAGNSFDYPYVHGKALMALGHSFCSMSAEAFCRDGSATPLLDLVCGKQKSTHIGLDSTHVRYEVFPKDLQKAISGYLDNGGGMIVSGSNIGSDGDISDFTSTVLGYKCRTFFGTGNGKIGEFEFHNKQNPYSYCVECPDALAPAGLKSRTLLKYNATRQSAAVLYKGKNYKVVSIGVPIETLKKEEDRKEILRMSLQALQTN